MKKLLITAFGPFDVEAVNPSEKAVALLPDSLDGLTLVKLQLPVVFGEAGDLLVEAIDREQPDAVLCIGQAGGRAGLTPERVAINMDDARIADNAGIRPVDQPIHPDGAPAHFATLPVKAMVQAIREAGIPASLSNSAGTYVCNHVMYRALDHISERGLATLAGFMHVPFLHEQVMDKPGTPSLSLTDIVTGIQAALRVIL